MILELLEEAVTGGAREEQACDVLGIEVRTVQRWRAEGVGEDQRRGPHTKPGNALTADERANVLALANTPEHRDMSPKQLVPKLADEGVYVASESSFYRILHAAMQMAHRGRARAPQKREVPTHVAYGPNEVWVWDITYLPTVMRGVFFYLYLILDLFSRKVVGWAVYEVESMDLSSELLEASIKAEGADPKKLVVHADNGGPMKGSTMLAKMQLLGVLPSFSRPGVSDDNAFAEAIFRHLKYTPSWPKKPFATLELARSWVATFVVWYNTKHRHSGIQFLTPAARHAGMDDKILAARKAVYERAKQRHPERWSGETRDCKPVQEVGLTPTGQATAAKRGAPSKGATRAAEASTSREKRSLPVARADLAKLGQGGLRAAPASGAGLASSARRAHRGLEPQTPQGEPKVAALEQVSPRRSRGRGKLSPCGKSKDKTSDEKEAQRLLPKPLVSRMTSRPPVPPTAQALAAWLRPFRVSVIRKLREPRQGGRSAGENAPQGSKLTSARRSTWPYPRRIRERVRPRRAPRRRYTNEQLDASAARRRQGLPSEGRELQVACRKQCRARPSDRPKRESEVDRAQATTTLTLTATAAGLLPSRSR